MTSLSSRAFLGWTAAFVAILALGQWGALAHMGRGAFTLWFGPAFILSLVVSWQGRWQRLLAAAISTVLVGLWPVSHWLTTGDPRPAKLYLVIAGMVDVVFLLSFAMDVGSRRGWIVNSPIRRRISYGFLFAVFLADLTGWPTGPWRSALSSAWLLVLVFAMFWPARRVAAQF
ncbi:MAG TPA: hypothetical protein VJN96_12520 [Vicinamibacterales bacterium]|nr:hypothetical protein [Vicinamibacterales bacterium]